MGVVAVRESHGRPRPVIGAGLGAGVELGDLVAVQTSHWVGRNPEGQVEDFHAVRLIYRGTCPEPSDPVVLDVGGTTADARWIPLDERRSVTWTANWRDALDQLLPQS